MYSRISGFLSGLITVKTMETVWILSKIAIVLLVAIIFVRASNKLIDRVYDEQRKKGRLASINQETIHVLKKAFRYIVYFTVFMSILSLFNIKISAILAGAGFAGIVVGFAAQKALGNVISGALLTVDRPFKLGDRIEIGDVYGDIIDIGMRSIRVKTTDNQMVTIPNSLVGDSNILNYTESKHFKTRLEIPIQVSYEADLKKVGDILLSIAKESQEILDSPEPEVLTRAFEAHGIRLELWVWTNLSREKRRTISRVLTRVREEFNKNKIEIPYERRVQIPWDLVKSQYYRDTDK